MLYYGIFIEVFDHYLYHGAVPRVSIFNVTVIENVGSVLVPINRTGGDLSRNTVIRASSRDGTAIGEYIAIRLSVSLYNIYSCMQGHFALPALAFISNCSWWGL